MIIHIILGIILGFIIWKLLKITFKSILWIVLIGIIALLFFPHLLFLVGGIGFLVLCALGALILFSIAGFFFFNN
ncbi:hypothetical protein [Bacillus sp. EB600]|uniref:hypothetical protein n=1 Tax=Bacillus sp. EB600 TaxID=2806345 RepID=UPI00210CDD57|nr:hypothetical protein [Bacillus sp. EB600]MCQ6280637.1 hypothetical protein [Bacillus sp. EB600]